MLLKSANNKIEYSHRIIYDNIAYLRTETLWVNKELELENELDFHTISWELDDSHGTLVEYFCIRMQPTGYRLKGWAGGDKHLNESNPVPEIEKLFKETIGKNLVYF